MDNNPFSMNWTNNWNDIQKKMWSDWSAMAQKSAFSSNPTANPFNFFQKSMEDSMDPMWSAFSPFQVTTPEELTRRSMMDSMNNFMNMSKGVFDTFQKMSEKGSASSEEWTTELDKNLQKFREYFSAPFQGGFGSLNPLSGWNSMLENIPSLSSEMMKQYMEGGQGELSMDKLMANSLNMPGLGLNREKQEKIQKAIQLGLAYQKIMGEFQTLMNKSSLKAADLFKQRLISMAQEGKPLQSLRDLHVLWVDCNEETNAETVGSKEYQEINPRLATALFTLKGHVQSMTDDTMSSLNMPTRKELNSAYLQIHDLKKKVRKLESQVKSQGQESDSTKLNRLRDDLEQLDVEALRKDVEALKKQLNISTTAAKAPAATRKAPVRRAKASTEKAKEPVKAAAKTPAKKGE
ncbi:MAG: class III poly(R)-hydroxyalkanoic acid synthase subunit PhaE [Magnetococcales bacterium]|nr:class III poly(R)-hydroxyalkanoic acid synthase subunit PhaE [Magnetococcales bacterium]